MSKEFQFKKSAVATPAGVIQLADSAVQRGKDLEVLANIIVIEKRALLRECMTACFTTALGPGILSFPSVESWVEVKDQTSACIVVLSTGGQENDSGAVQRDISLLSRAAGQLPIILLADAEQPGEIIEALEHGARGYIPTSVSLKIAIEAMRLVRAGGIYAPANSLIAANRKTPGSSSAPGNGTGNCTRAAPNLFTERQLAVLEALRKGKANKIIAYELNMRESTVKVHVRNIMKKFRAKNRTEVAYMAQALLNNQSP